MPGDPGRHLHARGSQALARATAERFQELDILVNNAGAGWGAPLEEFPASGWEKVIHTNVNGVFMLTVALLPQPRAGADAADPARVINIGSVDGLRTPSVENYSYSASKAAVEMLIRHLAKRLAGDHITVNAIAPGPFESKMTAFFLDVPESREIVEQMVPLKRIGRADDLAGLTLFLASERLLSDRHSDPGGRRPDGLQLTQMRAAGSTPQPYLLISRTTVPS